MRASRAAKNAFGADLVSRVLACIAVPFAAYVTIIADLAILVNLNTHTKVWDFYNKN
jgi:hypothetical protein